MFLYRRKLFGAFLIPLVALAATAGCHRVKKLMYEGFEREKWQQPERVIESLEIKAGAEVADIGAGSGYFTMRLARAVGAGGSVLALDVDGEMLTEIENRARAGELSNIKTIRVRGAGPGLPARPLDLIFLSNTYHHLENRVEYFADLRNHLKPDGRVAIIDFRPEGFIQKTLGHATAKTTIVREMAEAGFKIEQDLNYLPRQSFQIFAPE